MKNIKQVWKKNKMQILQFAILIIVFSVLGGFIHFRLNKIVDSDMASQLVLSKLLAEEGAILSKNWFYATELRVFSLQLVFAPLFHLTSDWNVVRTVGCIILYTILLMSIFYFCRQLKIQNYFALLGTIFMMPFSYEYFAFVLKNVNYVPCLSISFCAIGIAFAFVRTEKKRRKIALFLVAGLLALVSGVNGMRQLFVVYAPLLLASLLILFIDWKDTKQNFFDGLKTNIRVKFGFINVWTALVNVVGYLINSIYLSQIYDYTNYEKIEWDSFSITDVGSVLNGWITVLGFSSGELFSTVLLYNIVCFVITGLLCFAIYITLRNRKNSSFESIVMSSFLIGGFVISIILYSFTTMDYQPRYDLPIVVFGFPLIILMLSGNNFKLIQKKIIIAVLMLSVGICSASAYSKYVEADTTYELRNIASILKEAEYKNGYATFWNANVMTELSDGYLEIWSWQPNANDIVSINQVFEWAQVKSHTEQYPAGKVFLLLTENEEKKFSFLKNVSSDNILYRTPKTEADEDTTIYYVIYGFQTYDEMISIIGNYYADFYNCSNLIYGEDIAGERHLYSDGISYGPYITLYPGKYAICSRGEGLDNLFFDSVYRENSKTEEKTIEITNIKQTKNYIYYEIEISEEISNYEARFFNFSEKEVVLSELSITRIGSYYANFTNGSYLINGEDRFGERHLYSEGISYGPYITLQPGRYAVHCSGEGLDNLVFDSTYMAGLREINEEVVRQTTDYIYYEIQIGDVCEDFEARFFNNTEQEVILSSVSILRMN